MENEKIKSKYWNEEIKRDIPDMTPKARMSLAVALANEEKGDTGKANEMLDKAIDAEERGV